MLATSVILVLREVLEAAVLVSVLLAMSRTMGQRLRWAWWPLPLALMGSILFASSMDTLTDAFDGAGQEVVNASLQVLVFACAVLVVFLEGIWTESRWPAMRGVMICAVTLALVREGSEIWLYVSGFTVAADLRTSVLTGSAIGAGIGISLGALLYSALRALPETWQRHACLVLLSLIGAGMVMQATMLLEQVDWLEAGRPVWDSTAIVNESSISGELLYAVFGYEATPGRTQGLIYLASLSAFMLAYFASRALRKRLHVG
jgi:high-affinity iron transporter